jgi:glycosyltransferase involved in cell wall biosynthesis
VVGLIARLDPQKNHRGFFDAARLFFEQGGDARFILAGRGVTEDDADLVRWRDETGHPERILLAGPRGDVPQLMAALDVATSSSLGEAFPMVLVEAMASGVPCVATDVGDSRLIVADTGLVVPPDDAEGLAKGWSTLLAMPAEGRRELGRRARVRVQERFSIEEMAERVWGVYRGVLDGR